MNAPRPMSCAEAFRFLDDYVDGEMVADELAAVERHLEGCRSCTDEFEIERQLLEDIRAKLAQTRMPPDLMTRIRALLARE